MDTTSFLAAAEWLPRTSLWWIGIAALVIGGAGSVFPFWKSAEISPDAIMRRFYWTGTSICTLCIFLYGAPNWGGAVFGSVLFGLCFVFSAFFRSSHIKIRGRIFAASAEHRRPDRPPALSDEKRV
ncbi:MAG: hypothetical protein WBB07_16495 [Mycobacterium sp.]